VRLFDRRRAQFDTASAHEKVVTDGAVAAVPEGRILHHTVRDLDHYFAKLNAYTTAGAIDLHRRGRKRGAVAILLTWPFYFLRELVLKRSVLNGGPGIVWAMVNAVAPLMKYTKLFERGSRG
jgi:hypothetical protein